MGLKTSLTATAAISLLLTSCSTYHPVKPAKEAVTASRPSHALSLRAPSSSEAEENLNTSFEMMLNNEDPEKAFLDYLGGLKSIFLRAEAYLADFDQELDQAVAANSNISFENSKSYKKLITMYQLSHRLKDKITYHYLRLTDMAYDKTLAPEKRKMAKSILSKFKKKLDSKDPIEKISFDELKVEIAQALKERRGLSAKSLTPAELPGNTFKNDTEKVSVLRQYRKIMRSLGKVEADSGDELSQQVDSITEKMQFTDTAGREPQSELKFFPSTTTAGNVMGLVFPKGVWALTYDDGPNPVHTAAIVKNLDQLGVKATFFWLAQNVVRNQGLVDEVGEKGHARANHSWSHAQLTKLDAAGLQKEIVQSTAVEAKSYGEPVKFFRCPYGAGNSVSRIRQLIADQKMIHVFWNVDTLDWQDKDPESIFARTKKQMQAAGHGVVLFHDIHPQSVIASKKLVEWSKTFKGTADEIRWVTLPEIVDEMNGEKK